MLLKRFALLLPLLVAGLICHADTGDKPLIVATIKPLALIAGDLAGDWAEVDVLLAGNQEPHHVSLSISQRKKLTHADLVLWVSPKLEAFVAGVMGQLDSRKLIGFADSLSPGTASPHVGDMHYWLHPGLVSEFYRALAAKLAERFPEKSPQIHQQLETRLDELTTASRSIRKRLAPYTSAKLIVDHQAYGYFAEYFRLQIVGSLADESGVASGPRTLAALSRQGEVRCVVVEVLPPHRRATKMAETLEVKVVAIDPLGTSVDPRAGYIGLLEEVATGFETCLQAGR